ncbi:MAG: response regulator [Anaerolineales bacterium]
MNQIPHDILAGWTIVAIDDEPDSLLVAETILRAYGALIYTATNGADGLRLIRQMTPDFVISDISMPAIDGWGLIDALQRDRALTEIPVIALTAFDSARDRLRAFESGFYNYITKPLTVESFLQQLLNLLIDNPALNALLAQRHDHFRLSHA